MTALGIPPGKTDSEVAMFLKIVRSTHEDLYECDHYQSFPAPSDSDPEQMMTEFVLKRYGCSEPVMRLIVDRSEVGLQVYVMNSEGKTVERIFQS